MASWRGPSGVDSLARLDPPVCRLAVGLRTPKWAAADERGVVYLLTHEAPEARLYKLKPSRLNQGGEPELELFATFGTTARPSEPVGLAIDADGRVYAADGASSVLYQSGAGEPDLRTLFFETTGDFGSARTAQFEWAAQINSELASLGRTLVLLRSVEVRYAPAVSFYVPGGVTVWSAGAGDEPYLKTVAASGGLRDAVVTIPTTTGRLAPSSWASTSRRPATPAWTRARSWCSIRRRTPSPRGR